MKKIKKIKLKDNKKITSTELKNIHEVLDVLSKIKDFYFKKENQKGAGIWENISTEELLKKSSDSSFNELRFYSHLYSGETVATYENDNITPIVDDHVLRYLKLSAPLPDSWVFSPPAKMGEIGWNINETPVNIDTSYYQEKLSLIYTTGLGLFLDAKKRKNILEIGGGYGALAHHLAVNHEGMYINIDLMESLPFCASYLVGTLPDNVELKIYAGQEFDTNIKSNFICKNFEFLQINKNKSYVVLIPNFLSNDILNFDFNIDLAINTQSLSEMSEEQCIDYCNLIHKKIGKTGLFYEQNGNHSSHGGCDTLQILLNTFENLYQTDTLGITNLTNYYNNPEILGAVEIGANVNIAGNCDVNNILNKYQDSLHMDILVRSFEPTTRFMSRISMKYPDNNHPDIHDLYQKIGKGMTSHGWEGGSSNNLGDKGIFVIHDEDKSLKKKL